MANNCETTITIHSSRVTDTELHNLVWDGFTHNGKKYECPFRYEEYREMNDSDTTYGITRWSLTIEYGHALHAYLRTMDEALIMFVEETDEFNDWLQVRIHFGDGLVHWISEDVGYDEQNEEILMEDAEASMEKKRKDFMALLEHKANLLNPTSPYLKEPEIQKLSIEITRLVQWIMAEAHLHHEDVDKFNLMNESFVYHHAQGDKKKAFYEARKAKEFLINKYCVVDGEMISLKSQDV